MKQLSSVITGLESPDKRGSNSIGSPHGEITSAGKQSFGMVAPGATAADLAPEWTKSSQLLTRYLERWKATEPGTPVSQIIPEEHRAATLSSLSGCLKTGSLPQVGEIVRRMLAHDPKRDEIPKSVAEDWGLELLDKPLACIWWAYREEIRKPGAWAPDLGTFLKSVEHHERSTLRIVNQLKAIEGAKS